MHTYQLNTSTECGLNNSNAQWEDFPICEAINFKFDQILVLLDIYSLLKHDKHKVQANPSIIRLMII